MVLIDGFLLDMRIYETFNKRFLTQLSCLCYYLFSIMNPLIPIITNLHTPFFSSIYYYVFFPSQVFQVFLVFSLLVIFFLVFTSLYVQPTPIPLYIILLLFYFVICYYYLVPPSLSIFLSLSIFFFFSILLLSYYSIKKKKRTPYIPSHLIVFRFLFFFFLHYIFIYIYIVSRYIMII